MALLFILVNFPCRYQLPSRSFFGKTLIPKLYNDVAARLREETCERGEVLRLHHRHVEQPHAGPLHGTDCALHHRLATALQVSAGAVQSRGPHRGEPEGCNGRQPKQVGPRPSQPHRVHHRQRFEHCEGL